MSTSSQPSSISVLPHFTVCFLSHLRERKYLLSISPLSHYLCALLVLKFHYDIKEPGVVTSDRKCYLTFCFTKHNNIKYFLWIQKAQNKDSWNFMTCLKCVCHVLIQRVECIPKTMVGKFLLAQRRAFCFLFLLRAILSRWDWMKTLQGCSLKPVKYQEAKKALPGQTTTSGWGPECSSKFPQILLLRTPELAFF